MPISMKIISFLLLFAFQLAAGCDNEIPDNDNIPDPEISEKTQIEQQTEEQ